MNRDLTSLSSAERLRLFDRDAFAATRRQLARLAEAAQRPAETRTFASVNNQLYPSLGVRETSDAYEIAAELPGLEPADVEARLSGNVLTIIGEKRGEGPTEAGARRSAETAYGRFERVIPLAVEVDPAGAEAKFENGRFEVRLPKRPAAAAGAMRRVAIDG